MNKRQKKMLIRIIVCAVLLIVLNLLPLAGVNFQGIYGLVAFLIPYAIISYDILKKAFFGILRGRVFDENFLMAVASLGALILAVYESEGDYNEAIFVVLFYQVGELFENYAVGKSRRNISALMDIRPDYANVESMGEITKVDPSEVETGTVIVVMPGEKVPIDGIVIEGTSAINTCALTGESIPRDITSNDEVISGCINLTGVLKIRTNKTFGESTVSKILELVENSTSNKSKSEAFISKFARIYTPAVCLLALGLALLPPLVNIIFALGPASWSVWIYRALTFLVISCPCALVISIPLSFFAGIGGASKAGILIKGSNYMEALSKTSVVVFDKTGTLTQGVFEVDAVHHNSMEAQKLIEYAALAESSSSHPISRSLQEAYGGSIDRGRVHDIHEISGNGITAVVDGINVAVGNGKLMENLNIDYHICHSVGTIVHVALNNEYAGHIVTKDMLKPHSKEAVAALKNAGIKKVVMLTGDAKSVALEVAQKLEVDECCYELLPQDKVSKVEELLDLNGSTDKLAFVGDGINDAPVLARSDIGIAMGAMGSDAAIEAADIVLMDDDPLKIAKAIKISTKCLRIVYQNIAMALIIKFACLGLGAMGIANMWMAIFADVGVMILAVLNAIRALVVRED